MRSFIRGLLQALAVVEAAHPSLAPLCVSGEVFTSSHPCQSHPCPQTEVTPPCPPQQPCSSLAVCAGRGIQDGQPQSLFNWGEQPCNPALLQLLPWSLQGIAVPAPSQGLSRCFCPPATLCTPAPSSPAPPCALQTPLAPLARVLPALLPAGISWMDSSPGPELSIKKEGVTHHLVNSLGRAQAQGTLSCFQDDFSRWK